MKKFSIPLIAIGLMSSHPAMAGDWATFNDAGSITGWGYDSDSVDTTTGDVTTNTPAGATALTPAQYAEVPYIALQNGDVVQISPPAAPAPTLAQQAAAEIAGGLTITSTGTPALSGTYSTDAKAEQNFNTTATYINTTGKFPGGQTSLTWLDSSGSPHTFPNVTEWQAFATDVADFIYKNQMIEYQNSGTLPATTATIP